MRTDAVVAIVLAVVAVLLAPPIYSWATASMLVLNIAKRWDTLAMITVAFRVVAARLAEIPANARTLDR